MHLRARAAALIALFATAAAPGRAHSDPPSLTATALSREQFRSGVAAMQAGRWEEARQAFSRAYELTPRPDILFNLAGAQVQTQHMLEGAESYRRCLRETADQADVPFRDAARQALSDLERRLPHVAIRAHNVLATDTVTVDGQSLPATVLDVAIPIDPGGHHVSVTRDGTEVAHVSFEARLDETRDVVVDAPATARVVETRPPVFVRSQVAHHASQHHDQPTRPGISPWIWVGIGAAVLAVAATITVYEVAGGPTPFHGNVMPGVLEVP
jgi:hypothetical protein